MGYFSNGTEGEMYREQWCDRCIHEDTDGGCPVWNVHLLFNYEQHEQPDLKATLGELIPPEGCSNGQCRMFLEKL